MKKAAQLAVALAALALSAACGSSSQTSTAPTPTRCAMSAQADAATFSADGGNGTLRITTSRECTWSAQSDAAWLVLTSGATGQGDGTVGFRVEANDTPAPRNAAIAINDRRQQISQQGRPCEYDLSSEHEILTAAGGERTIQITASNDQCSWTAAASVPWITIVEGRQGSGNGKLRFTVAPAAGPTRTGSISVAGETVRIEQGTGCSFTLSAASLSVAASGGEQSIRVDASDAACGWTASSDVPWITADPASGTGSGAVAVRVAATNGPPRAGTITIAGQPVSVSQGTGCSVSVAPSSANLPAQGGPLSVAVESGPGCAWTAAANQSWISITAGTQGSGAGKVDLTVAANAGPARSGSVAIGGAGFTISQASGCTFSISPTTDSIAGTGGSAGIAVSTGAGCQWTAASGASWVTLSTTAGTGPGELRVTAASNDSPARTAIITVAGQAFTVNQPSMCTYILLPPFHQVDASGGNGNVLVIVNGPCTWTAESSVAWIQMTAGTSGRGDGLVQFTVAPNPGAARTGFVTIAGQQYRVMQGGQ